jgi:hypothetical protein
MDKDPADWKGKSISHNRIANLSRKEEGPQCVVVLWCVVVLYTSGEHHMRALVTAYSNILNLNPITEAKP